MRIHAGCITIYHKSCTFRVLHVMVLDSRLHGLRITAKGSLATRGSSTQQPGRKRRVILG